MTRLLNTYGMIAIAFAISTWSPDAPKHHRVYAFLFASIWPVAIYFTLSDDDESTLVSHEVQDK